MNSEYQTPHQDPQKASVQAQIMGPFYAHHQKPVCKEDTYGEIWNAGQVGLGSSLSESSRPGSTRPGPIYSLLFSIIRIPIPFFSCVLLLKMFNKSLRE